jgi:quercetin dioxygenase-like cupin family protein
MKPLHPIVRNAGEGDKQSFRGGGLHIWKLLAEDTDGAFFLFEDTMVKDKTTPLHLHPEAHEVTYVVDGEIEVQADGNRSRVRTGGMSFVPKGVAHAFIVVSAEARLITLQSPGAVGQAFYRGASDPAVDDTNDLVDLARLQVSAAANPRGITILGPPPFATAAIR